MAYPTDIKSKLNCPPGWIHVPHLFYELYWNTGPFADRWTSGGGPQPFCLSNGDCKGYSLHADFINGWDTKLLQHIIDTCDVSKSTESNGMETCPGVKRKESSQKCQVDNPYPETIDGVIKNLPGDNSWHGFGGAGDAGRIKSNGVVFVTTASCAETPTTGAVADSSPHTTQTGTAMVSIIPIQSSSVTNSVSMSLDSIESDHGATRKTGNSSPSAS